ncbi:MAG: CheW protein [Frankiales bacterium]|jgi:purine-binding chemotaxis protein CheW|nr:CheW protein [Frankiales bacterium]
MSNGLVTFVLGDREYAAPLLSIREVVRLEGLADLPGMTPPLAGVLDLRGTALPVLDLRTGATAERRGDVLVLESTPDHLVGVAVDRVIAVVDAAELSAGGPTGEELPSYVAAVLRGASGPVFLVDLAQMVDSTRKALLL